MVDLRKLDETIEKSGIKMTALSKKSGISRQTLYNRLNGIGEFTASEIVGITNALRLSAEEREDIFFAH